MSAANKGLTRAEPRASVLPIEVKGLLSKGTAQVLPFFVWDISVSGLGILISDPFKRGDEVTVTFGSPQMSVACTVEWCVIQEADFDFQEPSYRMGLKVNQPGTTFQRLVDHINALR